MFCLEALEGETARTLLLYEHYDLEDDEIIIDVIPLQELDKVSDDDFDDDMPPLLMQHQLWTYHLKQRSLVDKSFSNYIFLS